MFLGLPGIVLAFVLARLSSQSGAQEMRRHVSLLRARGATSRQLAGVLIGSEVLIAFLGAIVGLVLGTLLAFALFGAELLSIDPLVRLGWAALLVVPLVTLLAVLAAGSSLRALMADAVSTGRQEVQRASRPLWQRLYLDVVLLAGAVLTYFVVSANGVHPAVTTEGNPTVNLALSSFVAPFLLWLGGSLLLLRLGALALQRSSRLSAFLERLLGPGVGSRPHRWRRVRPRPRASWC